MEHFAEGSPDTVIDEQRAGALLDGMLSALGDLKRVLLLPPDITRRHSWAGELTVMLYRRLEKTAHVEILPALGTHEPMTEREIEVMFSGVPPRVFQVHDWRTSLSTLGVVPGTFIRDITGGKLGFPVTCEINRRLVEGEWDRIISIGQIVPHEVAGLANFNKNVFVGAGGRDTINRTHYIGAVCGMESAMGRAKTPVRAVFDYMSEHFAGDLPITYLLTVRDKDSRGEIVTRGLYAGDNEACFLRGAELCRRVNLDLLDKPIQKIVVYLDPEEFKSTWLGNKAIYRTRMVIADDGELVILAPGVRRFGEDDEIDRLIRKYGYRGTPHTLRMVAENPDLADNLSAAAHLIHGSSEGRFRVTYCPSHMSRKEVERVGFEYADYADVSRRYTPNHLRDGFNTMADGERVFFVSNPAVGLWALREHFED